MSRNPKFRKGTDLRPETQAEVLRRFIHRYTGDHTPQWIKGYEKEIPLHFASDKEWLEHTEFAVRGDGGLSLDRRFQYCRSNPTWPNNPELRKREYKKEEER